MTLTPNTIFIIIYISIMLITGILLLQREKKLKLMKYKIDIKYGSDVSIEAQLDYIINSTFEEYKLYNLEYRSTDYIKELEERTIVEDVCNMVIERISPIFLTQLSTYFNMDSIGKVIASKISTKVMEYRISKNLG